MVYADCPPKEKADTVSRQYRLFLRQFRLSNSGLYRVSVTLLAFLGDDHLFPFFHFGLALFDLAFGLLHFLLGCILGLFRSAHGTLR